MNSDQQTKSVETLMAALVIDERIKSPEAQPDVKDPAPVPQSL